MVIPLRTKSWQSEGKLFAAWRKGWDCQWVVIISQCKSGLIGQNRISSKEDRVGIFWTNLLIVTVQEQKTPEKYVNLFTHYSVGAPLSWITTSVQCGMEVISLWHSWGVVEAPQPSACLYFWFGCFSFVVLNIPHRLPIGSGQGSWQSEDQVNKLSGSSFGTLGRWLQTWSPTPADDMTPQIITLWKRHIGLDTSDSVPSSPLPPSCPNKNATVTLIWEENLGALTLPSVVQEWLDITVLGHFQKTSVSWILMHQHQPRWSSPKFLNQPFLAIFKAAVIFVT